MKRLREIFGKFYNPQHLISTGKHVLFSIGSRSIGKSTGWAIQLLFDYIRHGYEFIYVRRNDDELRRTCKEYFDDAVVLLNDAGADIEHVIYKNGEYRIKLKSEEEEKICGYGIGLSNESKFKSGHYGNVKWILYDEFIAPDKAKYLGRKEYFEYEYDCMVRLYQTVDRCRGKAVRNETKVIFIGNNLTYANPPFVALGIDRIIRPHMKLLNPKHEVWCVEQTSEVEATKEIRNSIAYRMSSEIQKRMNYDNDNGENDKSEIIRRMEGVCWPLCNLIWRGHTMGAYMMKRDGLIYISNRKNTKLTIAMSCGDQNKVNRVMADSERGKAYFETIRKAVLRGECIFQDRKCYNEVLNYFRMI